MNYKFLLFLFLFSSVVFAQTPVNDICSSAQNIGTLAAPGACGVGIQSGAITSIAGTNINATSENPYVTLGGCGMASPANSVWYTFTSPINGYGLNITVTGATFANPNIALYNGSNCNNLIGITCTVGVGGAATINVGSGIIPGQTYYLLVSGNTGDSGTFVLNVNAYQDCSDCLIESNLTVSPPPINGTYQPGQIVNFCYHINRYVQIANNWLHGVQLNFGAGWDLTTLVATPPSPYISTSAFWGGAIASCGSWNYYPAGTISAATGVVWPSGFYFNGVYATNGLGIPVSCVSAADGNPGNNYGDGESCVACAFNIPANQWNFCWSVRVTSVCSPGQNLSVTINTSGDGESGAWINPGCVDDPATNFSAVVSCCPPLVSSTSTCFGDDDGTATATPVGSSGPYTYSWTPGGETTQTITGLSAGNYTVSVTDANLCVTTGTVTVVGIPLPIVNPIANIIKCNSNLIIVPPFSSIPTGASYTWINSNTAIGLTNNGVGNIPSFIATNFSNIPISSIITVTPENSTPDECEGNPLSFTITVNPAQTVTINSSTICSGQTATLTATPNPSGGTYLWSGGQTTQSIIVSPPLTTTYTLTYSLNGCSVNANTVVTVNPIPIVTANSATICAGQFATLIATPSIAGGSYLWSTGQTTQSVSLSPNSSRSYTVTYTFNGCSSFAIPNFIVNHLPLFSFSNQTICNGQSAILNPNPDIAGGSYLWSGGQTTSTITESPNTTTSYSVTYTTIDGCSKTTNASITVNPVPTVTINSATICNGQSATLTATPSIAGGTYNWSSGQTTQSITPSPTSTTSYTVTYTTLAGCSNTNTSSITVNPVPTVTINSATICNGQSATLTATPSIAGGTYNWSSGQTTQSITPSPTSTTSYTVTYTTLAGCSNTNTSSITVDPVPTVTINSATICNGQSATLTATPSIAGGTYNWSSGQTTQSITPSPTSTTSYTVTYTTLAGCSNTNTSSITVNPVPTVTINSATICNGQSATLTATPSIAGGTYNWSSGQTTQSITPSPTSTTSYTVTYTTLAGCSNTNTSSITVNPVPTVTINSATICNGQSATLTATPSIAGGTYNWSSGQTTQSITPSPTSTTSYTVTYTTLAGCSNTNTSSITVDPVPTVTINSATICNGQSATLTATPSIAGGTYNWSSGQTTQSITPSPTSTTSYTVTYTTLAGCSNTNTSSITVNPVPTVTINSATICNGQSATLTATPSIAGGTYNWSSGQTTQSITPSPTSTTSYTVTYTTLAGCSNTNTSSITVNPVPTVTINSATICNGQSATLTATPSIAGGTYNWSSGQTTQSITPSPTSTTSYTVTYTTLAGCSNTNTSSITVNPVPTVTINSATICNGQSATLTATPSIAGGTYNWSSGQTTQSITPSPISTTSYTVTYTTLAGCSNTNTSSITVNPVPTVTINSATICNGQSAILNPNPDIAGGSYLWSGGQTTSTITESPNTTTSYSVTYTTLDGCSKTTNASITVNPVPTVTINSATICNGQSATLTATPSIAGGTYNWSSGQTTQSITPSPTSTTSYTVTYTTLAGCSNTNTSSITVNPVPTVTINSATICNGQSATLTATPSIAGGTYNWSSGQTTQSITPSPISTTSYTVTYTTLAGCSNTNTSSITVNPVPTVTINSATICNGQSATLTATPSIAGGTYNWSSGQTTQSITPSPISTTSYTVTYTTLAGCSNTNTSSITVNPVPTVTINSATICNGQSATLTATPSIAGGTYNWSSGQTTQSITPSPTSTTSYTVTYTTLAGCSNTNTSSITVNPVPTVTINSATICNGQSATLTATPSIAGGTYNWSSGQTTQSITPSPTSTTSYTVTYTTLAGCSNTNTSSITVDPVPTVTINSATICNGQSATLTATPSIAGGTYNWSSGQTTQSITPSPTSTTSYTVTYTTLAGCSNTNTSSITVNPVPTVTINSATICNGQSATLTATPSIAGGTYNWSSGQTTQSITPSPTSTTSYTVTYTTLAGCSNTNTSSITVNPVPTVTINSATICNGQSATLTATPSIAGGTYNWSSGQTTQSITPSPISTTSYTVTYTTLAGCSNTNTSSITVNPVPTVTINSATICNGQSATLTATPSIAGGTYNWSSGQTTQSITPSPTSTTSYTVTYTTLAGCSNTNTSSITVNPVPTVTINSATICNGQSATLTATPSIAGGTYNWSSGQTTQSITPSPTSTTSYTVTYTTLAGCSNTNTSSITVDPVPTVTINSATICNGQSATLTATPSIAGGTYNWSSGQTTQSITPSPTSTTSYTVTYTTLAGCSNTNTSSITVNPVPTVTINSATICNGQSATLTATPSIAGGTYNWSSGQTTQSITPSPTSTTSYTVTYTTLAGCSNTNTSSITVNPVPTVTINSATICNGQSATLTATPSIAGGTYNWSSGQITQSITDNPGITTSYTVTYTTLAGCSNTNTSSITVTPVPTVTINSATICNGQSATLTATPSIAGGTYNWSSGQTTQSITPSPTSTTSYTVTYTTLAGCSNTNTSSITVNPVPTVTINSATICNGQSATLTATPSIAGGTYNWSSGQTTQSITPSPISTTSYTVTYTTLAGCSNTNTSSITVNPLPIVSVPSNVTICANGIMPTLTFTSNLPNTTYTWTNSNTTIGLPSSGIGAISSFVVTNTAPAIITATITVTPTSNPTFCIGNQISFIIVVNPSDNSSFVYVPSTLCHTGSNISATITGGAGGIFSSTPLGLVFLNTSNGLIDAASSTLNSYTVTFTSNGICPTSSTNAIVVTNSPDAAFSYAGPYCKNASPNPMPILPNGSSAGVFTSTPLGLVFVNSSTGQLNLSACNPGTYTVTNSIAASGGCAAVSEIATVIINPVPTVTINSATICNGQSATLTATPSIAGGTYSWSSGQITQSITDNPGITTSYTVTYTTLAGCSNTNTSSITVNPVPTVTINSATICNGQSATLTATPSIAGGTYNWSSGQTTQSITPSPISTTSYTVTYTTLAGCSNTNTSSITVNPVPTVTINSATICNGQSATLTATPSIAGGTYNWSSGQTTQSITPSPTSTTSYTVTYTTLAGCSNTNTSSITVNPVPTVTINSATICNGQSATLTATPSIAGGTYNWSSGQTTQSITPSPTSTTSYTVTYTTLAGCSNTNTSSITVNPVPTVTINSATICNGQSATLTATPSIAGGTYNWSSGQTTQSITPSPTSTTSYTVTYTTLAGCSNTNTSSITVDPVPTVTINSATICNGQSATLTATPSIAGGTYNWSSGQTTQSITPSPTSTTSYTVTYTTLAGCSNTNTSSITVNPVPTVTINSATICNGQSATLTATPSIAGGTYNWSSGQTTQSITPSPTSTTSYTVTYTTLAGCSNTNTSSITVNPVPTVTINSATICNGQSATLTATPSIAGGTYNWSSGQITQSITPSPISTTSYTVTYTTLAGCSNTNTSSITVNPVPTVTINSATICNGQSATLTATPSIAGGTYNWSSGQTTQSITPSPTSTTSYTVTYTTLAGCSNTNTSSITVNPVPTVTINSATICNGQSATLTATPSIAGGTYNWSSGQTTQSITPSPTSTTSYTVTYTTLAGCSNTNTSSITVDPVPTVTINSATICNGQSATLTATPSIAGGTYNWSSGQTTQSITPSPTSTTSYTVTYTTLAGCSNTNTSSITVNPVPTVTINSATICNGQSATLTATPSIAGGTYNWSSGQTTQSITPSPTSTTSYTVTYTTLAGCSNTNTSSITVNPVPTVTINSATICNGQSATLTATPSIAGGTYNWSSGQITQSITDNPGITTSYTVTYTTLAGCSNTNTSSITVTPVPTVTINSATICNGQSATLTATPSIAGGTYNWSSGQTTQSITPSPTSTTSYTVTYTTLAGCSNTNTSSITVNPVPTVTINSATICNGQSATLTATPSIAGGTYNWSSGQTTQSITPSPISTTSYTVTYTTLAGCSNTNTSSITVNPVPTVTINSATICNGQSATLTATPSIAGGTYNWSSGQTTQSITPSPTSTTSYTVTYTTLAGCSNTNTSSITVNPVPTVTINSATICNGQSATLTATPSIAGGTYNWSSGQTTQSITPSPTSTTSYTVTYTTLAGCSNTNTSSITVNPVPTVTINSATICNGQSATLTATPSIAGGTYNWSSGQTTQSITPSPTSTTSYTVTYTTLAGCSNTNTSSIAVISAPIVSVNSATICVGSSAILNATASPPGGTYLWTPTGESTPSITVTPPTNTVYSVIYTLACPSTASGGVLVSPYPIASFTAPQSIIISNPTISFVNTSIGGVSWLWNFGDPNAANMNISSLENPSHTYFDVGTYCINLTVTNAANCISNYSWCLVIEPEFSFYIPSAFSPNGDHINDDFFGKGVSIKEYEMSVFDRWGLEIFHCDDINKHWDGTMKGSTEMVQQDVYVYVVNLIDIHNEKHRYMGSVTVVK